jgi:hypothetical protein
VAATVCAAATVVEGAGIEDGSASSNNLRRKRRAELFQVNEPLSKASELTQFDHEELLFSDVLEESNEIFRYLMVSGSNSGGPGPTPCPDRAAYITERVEEWATPAELSDPSSPQSLALTWLIEDEEGTPCDLLNLDQRYGAAVFYYALDGDGWFSSTNWLSSAPVCNWEGVNCDASGLLTEIDLGTSGTNSLDDTIFNFLRTIHFHSLFMYSLFLNIIVWNPLVIGENNLTGSLPQQLELFVKMTELELRINKVGGTIPESISAMTDLTLLDLEMNNLVGPVVPDFMFSLGSTLTSYRVSFNDLTGSIPGAIGDELPNLEQFWLAGNEGVVGSLPDSIGGLTKLVTFFVYNTTITGVLPTTIGNMASLRTLDLAYTKISGAIPDQLFDASSLTEIYLNSLNMEGTISSRIGQLSGLTDMWLSNNTFAGTLPSELYQLDNMRKLFHVKIIFTASPTNFT